MDPGRRHSVNNVNSGGLQESDLSEAYLFYICVTHFNMSEISRLPLLDIRFFRFRSNAVPCDSGHLFFISTCLSLRGFICRVTI